MFADAGLGRCCPPRAWRRQKQLPSPVSGPLRVALSRSQGRPSRKPSSVSRMKLRSRHRPYTQVRGSINFIPMGPMSGSSPQKRDSHMGPWTRTERHFWGIATPHSYRTVKHCCSKPMLPNEQTVNKATNTILSSLTRGRLR